MFIPDPYPLKQTPVLYQTLGETKVENTGFERLWLIQQERMRLVEMRNKQKMLFPNLSKEYEKLYNELITVIDNFKF